MKRIALALTLLATTLTTNPATAAGTRYLAVTATPGVGQVTWQIRNYWSNVAVLSTRLGTVDVSGYRTVNPLTIVESVPAGECVSLTVGGYWLGVPRVNVAGVLTAGACAQ
jgi:hypothetical protein